jgi:hypothetical protein
MPFLRSLLKDLVEKRLWPVALLLVAALAAVPMLVGRTAGTAPTTAPAPAAGAGGAATTANASVTLATEPSDERHDDGRVRDPFTSPVAPKDEDDTTVSAPKGAATAPAASAPSQSATATASTGSASTTARRSTGSTGASATGSTGASTSTPKATPKKTTTPAKPKPKPKPKAVDPTDTYHVSLRFGVNGGALKTLKDVARLSPLPSETDPFFVFLGVLQTEKTHEQRAVFMVSSDAVPNGEGACHPTKQDCETVELTKGQTIFFDYTAPDGTPTQYQLQLAGIHKTQITSTAKAQAAIARHSAVGQELLRDAATRNARPTAGARAYRFVPATGLLVRAKRRHVTARAAAAGAIPGLALVDGKDQPGIPVWHSPKKKHARTR